jgi:type I restriction enzyme M protein
MLSAEIRSSIDRIWNTFWANETTNPLTVVEQITFLIFMKLLDDNQIVQERNANLLHTTLKDPVFKKGLCVVSDDPRVEIPYADQRWQNFRHKAPDEMHRIVRDFVFPFVKSLGSGRDSAFSRYMVDAQFEIHKPKVLAVAVAEIEAMQLSGKDVMGDVYEDLLDRIKSSGENGQFRSPGHIIGMMVELMEPTLDDRILDPAMGTAGFLAGAARYVTSHYAKELTNKKRMEHFKTTMFTGFDIDKKMLRIGAMNMMLHGVEAPDIRLNNSIEPDAAKRADYTLCLANPPFSGNMTEISIAPDLLAIANTKKTELLFAALFTRLLKIGGRAASIVPQGVLFGSSKAHVGVRRELVENQKLLAVVSMPSGIFLPYSGVATAVLAFVKTDHGGTDSVWFYNMEADGFSLDQKREPVKENDIPDLLAQFKARDPAKPGDRKGKCFFVPKAEIAANNYDLSFNKYREVEYVAEHFPPAAELLGEIEALEHDFAAGLRELKGML